MATLPVTVVIARVDPTNPQRISEDSILMAIEADDWHAACAIATLHGWLGDEYQRYWTVEEGMAFAAALTRALPDVPDVPEHAPRSSILERVAGWRVVASSGGGPVDDEERYDFLSRLINLVRGHAIGVDHS
jgi:hypothetical protein